MNFTNITTVSLILINISYENLTLPNNESSQYNDNSEKSNVTNDDKSKEIANMIKLIGYPLIIIFGTIGNMLSFYIMQRGSLKDVSTCFYMSVLAVADTSKLHYCIYWFFYILRQKKTNKSL